MEQLVRSAIDRGWYYVVESDPSALPPDRRIAADDGRVLTRRLHGYPARVHVLDRSGAALPPAALLRGASAAGRALEAHGRGLLRPLRVILGPAGTSEEVRIAGDGMKEMVVDGVRLANEATRHPAERRALELLERCGADDPVRAGQTGLSVPPAPARRVLFFESLMNTDMPHNDQELSGGVLHMASALRSVGSEVVLANVKIAIVGTDRTPYGLDALPAVLGSGPIDLVCITLLEGYFEGAVALIQALRAHGCRAHVAVGGVMPTLAPEQVAAHLPGVSFVCRGAGEVFVPRLAKIVGTSVAGEPFTDAQRNALLAMDGILALTADELVAGNPGQVVKVPELDAVDLDLSLLDGRHVRAGIEISTSRGCIHRCTFCTIMGRESYQARTARGTIELLGKYEARFRELFGDAIPPTAYRVHISDDDFACDRERAATVFRALLDTPFRLSSAQVSVADLCRRENDRLLPEPDATLLDAIRPECFADNGRPIPAGDFVADHRSRNWSAFLQLGVETFSDAELVRLGKGYRLAHVRAIAAEMERRRLHWDAYFILSNSATTADELLDSVMEVCRFKLRWPQWFHLRFPIVPRLVSYWPSASYRRLLRAGRENVCATRFVASAPNHPELDYPFVRHDEPGDGWVAAALPPDDAIDTPTFLTDGGFYTESLVRLRELWLRRWNDMPAGDEKRRGERLLRRLDDAPRRLAFGLLERAQRSERRRPAGAPPAEPVGRRDVGGPAAETAARHDDWPGDAPRLDQAFDTVARLLGPIETWKRQYQRWTSEEVPRLVVIPTWQCELRCTYCFIPKQDGRVMSVETMERAIDMLLSTERPDVILQFFGGEALMEWELVRHALEYGSSRAAALGKTIRFIISSNGWSLDEERLAILSAFPVKLELSLDGDPATQNKFRPAFEGGDSYEHSIVPRARAIVASGLPHDVIMVVHPNDVRRLRENFFHIAALGFDRIQINFALGFPWSDALRETFATELHAIGAELRERWARGERLSLINLEQEPPPVRLNAEITVDWDGTVYGGNSFLHETEHKDHFRLGTLDDLRGFDRYWLDAPTNDAMLDWSYRARITENNLKVGAIMRSFIRWMRKRGIGSERHGNRREVAHA